MGKPIGEVSELAGLHRNWIRGIIKHYNKRGAEAAVDQHRINPGGRAAYLSATQLQELEQALSEPAPDGGLWTGSKVTAWIAERTGRHIYPQLEWSYLQELGFVLRKSRPQHQRAASEEE